MKVPIAIVFVASATSLVFAQEDANALRDQLREIARPKFLAQVTKFEGSCERCRLARG
jgi:hypothetical protein